MKKNTITFTLNLNQLQLFLIFVYFAFPLGFSVYLISSFWYQDPRVSLSLTKILLSCMIYKVKLIIQKILNIAFLIRTVAQNSRVKCPSNPLTQFTGLTYIFIDLKYYLRNCN